MKKWEEFEKEVNSYLEDALSEYNLIIDTLGGTDSTMPDIKITSPKGKSFFLETKMPSAQTSQFVVLLEDNKFLYSSKNKSESNEYSDRIIEELNKNFNKYSDIRQNQIIVAVPNNIAGGWIAFNMKQKGVEFILTVGENDDKKVIPIDSIENYFNIRTILRRKKSGSTGLSKSYYDDFLNSFERKFGQKCTLIFKDAKVFVKYNKTLTKSECYIDSVFLKSEKKYFLSYKEDLDLYEVKITSGTNNPNILFEINNKADTIVDMPDLQILIEYLNNI